MQAVGSAALVYVAWIVGGILSLAGAITYAELGAMKPQAGGEYIYIRDAYGPMPAFLYGWTWFAVAKPASIATLVVGFVRILGTFPALSYLNRPFLTKPLTVTYGQLVAIAAAALITALNYIGIKRAGDFQVVFTALKLRHHHRRRPADVHGIQRHLAQLRHNVLRSHRRLCRIHGGAHRGALGLRRMERPQHGERRDSRSRPRHSDRADPRRRNRCRALHADQRRRAIRSAGEPPSPLRNGRRRKRRRSRSVCGERLSSLQEWRCRFWFR